MTGHGELCCFWCLGKRSALEIRLDCVPAESWELAGMAFFSEGSCPRGPGSRPGVCGPQDLEVGWAGTGEQQVTARSSNAILV